jgi:hypothetical protein
MNGNEDPKTELQNLRALLVARRDEEREQVRRFRALANERDVRVEQLSARLVEIDTAIEAINERRRS